MNKRIVAVAGALVLIIGGALFASFALRGSEAPGADSSSTAAQPSASAGAGSYVEYSAAAISEAEGRTFLFFHAPWCSQCGEIEKDIVAEGVPEGVSIVKVDYDSHQDLRQKYGVTLQTTFVEVDSDGKKLNSHVAYNDPRLQAVLDEMI